MRFHSTILPVVFALVAGALFVCTPASAQDKGEPKERDLKKERELEKKCLECHDDELLMGGGKTGKLKSLTVDPARYQNSIHTKKDLTCFSCHPDARVDYHPREGVTILGCGDCHDHKDQAEEFARSHHGLALARERRNAPDCQDCHGNHYIVAKDEAQYQVAPRNVGAACLACHPDRGPASDVVQWMGRRRISAHGKLNFSQDYTRQGCTLCHFGDHTHHTPENVPACGACHRAGYDGGPKALGNVHLDGEGFPGLFQGLVRGGGFLLTLLLASLFLVPLALAGFAFVRRGSPAPVTGEKGGADE